MSLVPVYICAFLITLLRVGWVPVVVLFAHELCAHVFNLYRIWPPIDIPLHFFGGVSMAVFAAGGLQVFKEHGIIKKPERLLCLTLIFMFACTAATFWEFAEWLADNTIGTTCQVGLDDTMLDLFMGVAGGALIVFIIMIRMIREEVAARREECKS